MPSPAPLTGLAGITSNVVVGVGDLQVSNNPAAMLTTYSLGSCLGVTIYDPITRAGGLLHVMLPDSDLSPDKARKQPAMFMDSGLAALFRAAYELNADKYRIQICVAGGAQVMDAGAVFNIGQRNYSALTAILRKHGLRIQAEDVGGFVSRTMTLNLATGEVRLKLGGATRETVLFCG